MSAGAPHTAGLRRALVTGGAAGIGWAICRELAAAGVLCAVADIDAKKAGDRTAELGAGHIALGVDLSDPAAALALPARAAEALGGLDIVINNAGITDTSGRRIGEIPAVDFARLVAVNLSSVEGICRAALDLLPKGGVVVNLASGAAFRPIALRGAYSATKAGVLALTETLDREAAPRGQRVTAVAPGFVRTELVEGLIANGRLDATAAAARVPLGRLGEPEDIARAVAFLVSPEGAPLAGHHLLVDGGSAAAAGAARPDGAPGPGRRSDRIAILGEGPAAERLAARAGDRALRLAAPEALAGTDAGAVIDTRGLTAASASAALTDAHALATALDDAGGAPGLSILFLTCGATTTRAALGMLARTMALEWGARGHRVNALDWDGPALTGLEGPALWLCGAEAGYVTGQIVRAGPPREGSTPEQTIRPAADARSAGGK